MKRSREFTEEEAEDDHELQEAIEASLCTYAFQLQTEEVLLSSDAKYASQLQFEEALRASEALGDSSSSAQFSEKHADLQSYPFNKRKIGFSETAKDCESVSETKDYESVSETRELCLICLHAKLPSELFCRIACSHKYCVDCVLLYINSKVAEKSLPIFCPGSDCQEELSFEQCQGILPTGILEKWNLIFAESTIPEAQKFYCPFKDCSALLHNDLAGVGTSTETRCVKQAECPECRRLFCANCRTSWHEGLEYFELKKYTSPLGEDDIVFQRLVKERDWRHCAKCHRTIEKVTGCSHITCRCGFEFCYVCGAEWKNKKATCQCPLWDLHNILREPIDDDFDDDDYDDNDDCYDSEDDNLLF
eukprot:TRINITY_DN4148_c0_g2_i1.p1 TRINITY_DN4148_c0_g2~~TRINITY_DN4148_c0_g2_i1.p1  ORF type:complete len:363 (-),score=43.83 TRINITY_DN4148_c0_g2_i1:282-1370(-)